MNAMLNAAMQKGLLRAIDAQFADQLARLFAEADPIAMLSAAWVSRRLGDGHVCLDLVAGVPWLDAPDQGRTPDLVQWKSALSDAGFVGGPGETQALILDGSRLYLQRYWEYEQTLAARLRTRATRIEDIDLVQLKSGLERLFDSSAPQPDWQKIAAATAVLHRFTVISGGPGTGKTHTLAAILALLIEQAETAGQSLRIGLAAPTGKAAARIAESLETARQRLKLAPSIRDALPTDAGTLHRLLGLHPVRSQPRYGAERPLPIDVLVIDEASMVDLPLMAKTVAALPDHARLILLGDKDQLASVEAGNVLADICNDGGDRPVSPELAVQFRQLGIALPSAERPQPALADSIVQLRHSYRFAAGGEIARLAEAVNRADSDAIDNILAAPGTSVQFLSNADRPGLLQRIVDAYRPLCEATHIDDALGALKRFRVLTALRRGPDGVEHLNARIEQAMHRVLRIPASTAQPWYRGRPIMITRNAPDLNLFNGDIGLCWNDHHKPDRLGVAFPTADGDLRWLSPQRLPQHETVFAMTVHKSQGSEFDQVMLVLGEIANPVTTRELIYTGITRARHRITLIASDAALKSGIDTRTQRGGGLMDRCWT
ncbi:MAG: exodeoxyribonuclease V subunit alpha [Gammaproteobacteria bacterium]|nr:exodeoxyribonuclease V subunit alpha [Gammaproteobacteria bacterium]MCP5137774.1 exodeoxyribonuclease V subunit alpha [Gammaproteobacteria bacterium]